MTTQNLIGSVIADGVSGKYAFVQVYNPSSSGVDLYVDQIDVAWNATDPVINGLNNRSGFDFNFNSAALGSVIRKMVDVDASNVTDSLIELRSYQAVPPFPASRIFFEKWPQAALNSMPTPLARPLKIPPGYGLLVRAAQPNTYNIFSVQGYTVSP